MMTNNRITTKIFREDLPALQALKEKQKLTSIADTVAWMLEQLDPPTSPTRKLSVIISENNMGELSAVVYEQPAYNQEALKYGATKIKQLD